MKIIAGPSHDRFSPQMVVKSKGNGTPYFRKIQVGEILFHLARFLCDGISEYKMI